MKTSNPLKAHPWVIEAAGVVTVVVDRLTSIVRAARIKSSAGSKIPGQKAVGGIIGAGLCAIVKRKSRRAKIILACLSCGVCCAASAAQELVLAWEPSASPDVAGYFLYYGSESGVYANKLDAGLNTQETVSNLVEGQTYYFVVTAYDAIGDESPPSNEMQYITPGLLQLTGSIPQTMNLQFPVAPGHWYEIQASRDLKSWTTIDVTSVAISNGWIPFADSMMGQFTSRFYRLVMH